MVPTPLTTQARRLRRSGNTHALRCVVTRWALGLLKASARTEEGKTSQRRN